MTPLQHDINDLTTFMQSAVFESLDDSTKTALEHITDEIIDSALTPRGGSLAASVKP